MNYPIPENEFLRLSNLSELDVDYSSLHENFKELTKLAAKVAGTEISLINLLDSYTQWTIARYGIDLIQMPREESVCQFTIMADNQFEVSDLREDSSFSDKFYTKAPLSLRYYFGIPLKDQYGTNIGALCVFGSKVNMLSPEKTEMLSIIADEVVKQLINFKAFNELKEELRIANEVKKKAAHDIRGPIAGIIGLSQIITGREKNEASDVVIEVLDLIHKSSKSLLEMTDEILTENEVKEELTRNQFNLTLFRESLHHLYQPQAKSKKINLVIDLTEGTKYNYFSRNKLVQITGNLISNALKFTPLCGKVNVNLALNIENGERKLIISVQDSGDGIETAIIEHIMEGKASSLKGTSGEKGYGFGLDLVRRLVISLNGTMEIFNSFESSGAIFKVTIPLNSEIN